MSRFKFIMAADPQYEWGPNDDKNMSLGGTWKGLPGISEKNCSYYSNYETLAEKQVESMNKLIAANPDIAGVMFNGDLVDFNEWKPAIKDMDLAGFKKIYEKIQKPMYCGLGNHDYYFNVDDTYQNIGATSMIEYVIENCKKNEISNIDYRKMEDYTFPSLRTVYTGSFSFSFDIGNVHFIQLHYYPGYTNKWGDFRADRARKIEVNVTDCYDWLEYDLKTARATGKAIIVGHHYYDYDDSYERYVELFDKYKVSAIFVGHRHKYYGKVSIPHSNIPMFYCGSTSQANYILMEFDDKEVTVRGVSSLDGNCNYIEEATDKFELITAEENYDVENPENLAGYVDFFSEGGYTVEFTLKYKVDGRQYEFETGRMRLGNKKTYDLPAGAYEYEVSCRAWNGSKWKAPFFTQDSDTPFNCTFRTYGTLPNPKMEIIKE